MRNGKTALPVLVGILALGIAAFPSLFVEGETTGSTVPGLHPTTESALPSMLFQDDAAAASRAEDVSRQPQQAHPAEMLVKSGPAEAAEERSAPVADMLPPGVPPGYVYWKTVRAKVTAYEPGPRSCGPYADGKTSIGHNAWKMKGVAADPTAVPYGTYCVIPGAGAKVVDDTGGAMRQSWRNNGRYHFDVRMSTYSQARQWGVKELEVKLYRKAL